MQELLECHMHEHPLNAKPQNLTHLTVKVRENA